MTPLERSLAAPERAARPKPIDVFKLARKMWLNGEKINLGKISEELGIGRATMSRWVGSKDRLLAEVLWSLYEPIFQNAKNESPGTGPAYVAEVYRRVMQAMLDAKPLQDFVAQDSQYALGVLTASRLVQERRLETCKALLQEQVDRGHLDLPLDIDTTAFVITRLNESFVYSDALVGTVPSTDKAVAAIRVLTGDSLKKA
ncbi:MAG: transcriptional regulator [Pseudomonadaceae bacterium]|nr:MAG: transcriptional regulator [Pseudomonadaceae bacterium]